MDFTRDPIIETIISPKDGFKLSIRSSRHANQDEYLVNAVEIVSFGSALFFRSLEKPKSFLLPISDYEVVEVKEARMVLKNVSVDKPIKIGESKPATDEKENIKPDSEIKKSSKKKNSRKRRSNTKIEGQPSNSDNERKNEKILKPLPPAPKAEGGGSKDEVETSSSFIPRVFPTPPKIIGRKLPEPASEEISEGNLLPDELVSESQTNNDFNDSIGEDFRDEEEISNLDSPVAGASHFSEEKKEDQESL